MAKKYVLSDGDLRLASRCGVSREDAQKAFDRAAKSADDSAIFYAHMYNSAARRPANVYEPDRMRRDRLDRYINLD